MEASEPWDFVSKTLELLVWCSTKHRLHIISTGSHLSHASKLEKPIPSRPWNHIFTANLLKICTTQNSSESLNMEHPLSTSNCRSLYFCGNMKPVSLEIDPKSQVPVVSGTSIAMQVPEANSVIIPAYWALGFKRWTVQNGEGSASVYGDPDPRNCMKPYAGLTACIFGDNFSGQKSTVK